VLPRGYDFVGWLNDSDVIIAVNPDGSETTLYGGDRLARAAVECVDLRVARVAVECEDGEVARLAMRVLAIKGSCERDMSC